MKQDLQQHHFQLPTLSCWTHTWRQPTSNYLHSDHHDGQVFFNPGNPPEAPSRGSLVKWLLRRKRATWQVDYSAELEQRLAAGRVIPHERPQANLDDWQVWFIGHATALIQIGPYNFLTDPNWAEFAGPQQGRGPKRACPAGIALEELPPIDAVLLSHNHYDHMDLATLTWLHEKFAMPIFTGLGNASYLPQEFDVVELDWWQWQELGDFKIVFTPAQHSSGRGLRDYNRALWGGFVIKHGADYCFFAGDTGYSNHFKTIHQRLGPPRVALLPVNCYEAKDVLRYLHLSPEDAFQAHKDLHSKCSVAVRYRTFQVNSEGREQPEHELHKVMQKTSKFINPFYCLHEGKKIIV